MSTGGGGAPFAAVLERRGRFTVPSELFARRDGAPQTRGRLTVDPRRAHAREGDLVLVRVVPSRRGARAEIVRRIGRPDVARDVIEALMLDRGLRRTFDGASEREAAAASGEVGVVRRDLRHLPTFTVDPATARDFDDAISAERIDSARIRVWVHIADVAAYVRPGSRVDRIARARGTSVYVPGAVEPMLPEILSGDRCSLVPGEDRPAVTVELELAGAKVVRSSFARTLIRSDARLDYDRVERIFAGAEAASDPWATPLSVARAAASALAAERAKRGGLEISSGEPQFSFDRRGHVVAVHIEEQTESHQLIEQLMIAANEQVASLLEDRRIPALYRVHEQPDPERVIRLVEQLASLELPTPPVPERLSPSGAGELVGEISQLLARHLRARAHGPLAYSSLILRSLKQAYYSPANIGHAGLRSARYCHFTSPIRRYPDLVCHRALLSAVGAGEEAPDAAELAELGQATSLREREAMDIERAADDIASCFALAQQDPQRVWEGEIVGLIGAGAFVAFGGGYQGMLAVRRMRGDWWELDERGTILHGSRSGARIRLGDPVLVRVRSIEAPRGRVDLDLA